MSDFRDSGQSSSESPRTGERSTADGARDSGASSAGDRPDGHHGSAGGADPSNRAERGSLSSPGDRDGGARADLPPDGGGGMSGDGYSAMGTTPVPRSDASDPPPPSEAKQAPATPADGRTGSSENPDAPKAGEKTSSTEEDVADTAEAGEKLHAGYELGKAAGAGARAAESAMAKQEAGAGPSLQFISEGIDAVAKALTEGLDGVTPFIVPEGVMKEIMKQSGVETGDGA